MVGRKTVFAVNTKDLKLGIGLTDQGFVSGVEYLAEPQEIATLPSQTLLDQAAVGPLDLCIGDLYFSSGSSVVVAKSKIWTDGGHFRVDFKDIKLAVRLIHVGSNLAFATGHRGDLVGIFFLNILPYTTESRASMSSLFAVNQCSEKPTSR